MAISLVGTPTTASRNGAVGTTLAPALPAGVAEGDVLVLIAYSADGSAVTAVGYDAEGNQPAGDVAGTLYCLTRPVGAGETAPTVTFGVGHARHTCTLIALRGVDLTNPFGTLVGVSRDHPATGVATNLATVTMDQAGAVIHGVGTGNETAFTWGTGTTELSDVTGEVGQATNGRHHSTGWENDVGPGASTQRTVTDTNPTGAAANNLAMIALPVYAAPPPEVVTGTATNVDHDSATLNATVDANGAATTYAFGYVTEEQFLATGWTGQTVVPPNPFGDAGSGADPVPVSQPITGLEPGTAYRFRVGAWHAGSSIVFGDGVPFTTEALGDPAPGIVGDPAVSHSATNALSHTVALPDDIAAGETVVVAACSDGNPDFGWPEGWVEVTDESGDANTARLAVAYLDAEGGEPASITVTTSTSEIIAAVAFRVHGAVSPPQAGGEFSGLGSVASPLKAASSWGIAQTLWVAVLGWDDDGTATVTGYPDGYDALAAETAGVVGGAGIAAASRQLFAGGENAGNFTIAADRSWNTVVIAIPLGAPLPAMPAGSFYAGFEGPTLSEWTWRNRSDGGVMAAVLAADVGIEARTGDAVGHFEVTAQNQLDGDIHSKVYKEWALPGYQEDWVDDDGRTLKRLPRNSPAGVYSAWFWIPADYEAGPEWTNIFQFKESYLENPADEETWHQDPSWWVNLRDDAGTPSLILNRWLEENGWLPESMVPAPLGRWFEIKAELHPGERIEWSLDGEPWFTATNDMYPVGLMHDHSTGWVFGVGHYGGLGKLWIDDASFAGHPATPAARVVSEPVDDRIYIEAESASGRLTRWADDDPDASGIPVGVEVHDTSPGGFADAKWGFVRDPRRDWPDLDLIDKVKVYGRTAPLERSLFEGQQEQFPSEIGESFSIGNQAIGRQRLLAAKPYRELIIDRGGGNWQAMRLARRAQVLQTPAIIDSDYTASTEGGGVKFDGSAGKSIPFQSIAELCYSLPAGLRASVLAYKGIEANTANVESPTLFAADSEDLQTGQITSALTLDDTIRSAVLSAAKRHLVLRARAAATHTPPATEPFSRTFEDLAVVGSHGLALRDVADDLPGVYGHDALAHVVAPSGLNYTTGPNGTIRDNPSFVIPQLAWLGSGHKRWDAVLEVNAWFLWRPEVWEDDTFWWQPWDADALTWKARIQGGAHWSPAGRQASTLFNGVIVSAQDHAGVERTAGPPGSGCDIESELLQNTDPSNPLNSHGEERWEELNVGYPLTFGPTGSAIQLGYVWMVDHSRPQRSGTLTVRPLGDGHIPQLEHPTIGAVPIWAARSGDYIDLVDFPDPEPFKVLDRKYSHESKTATFTLDTASTALSAILARLEVKTASR